MTRETDEINNAYQACLDGAYTIDTIIATHNRGSDATDEDFEWDATHDEKKARVSRNVGYLKYQTDTYSDWGDRDFTTINAAITAADAFTE